MAHLPDESKINFKLTGKFRNITFALMGLGLLLIAAQFLLPWHEEGGEHHGNVRLFYSMHLALMLALPLTLGGIYFVAFNHLAGSFWNVTVRRIAENYVWYLPVVMILMIVVFSGLGNVYHHWVHPSNPQDPLLAIKAPWLSTPFFIGRNLVWIIIWAVFGGLFLKHSLDQDKDGSYSHTKTMTRMGAGFLVVFGLTWSATTWDLTMSIDPHWFSTMWAVYGFAGLALTAYASLILWVWFLKKSGYYGDSLNENHIHDLGKYMWGHTIFWAYIGFSQFMLIWYGHIPEETTFYHYRMYTFNEATGNPEYSTWSYVSLLLVIVRFILPFFLIIKRESKRKLGYLASVSVLVIFGQILDMYWISYPMLTEKHSFIMPSWYELGPILFVLGSFMFVVGWRLTKNSLIPKKDPRIEECLHWHQ